MLLINRTELEKALPMTTVIEAIEEGFREHQRGRSLTPPRMHVELEPVEGVYLLMPSYLENGSLFGTKLLSVYPRNRQRQKPTINSVYILNDAVDGTFLAMMDGIFLTGVRTGAASAVAAKYLAREDASVHGIIGCGGQALYQAEAIAAVRPIEKLLFCDHKKESAEALAREAAARFSIPARALDTPAAVACRADILTTVTTSSTPVVKLSDLKPGCHVNAVGAFKPTMQEIDGDIVQEALVVVDSYEGCLREAGDLIIPIERGEYRRENIHAELGEILLGEKYGRSSNAQITLFKSVGVAFEDLSAARLAYRAATREGLGTSLSLED